MSDFLNGFDKESFASDLTGWFRENQRSLPWRESKDPYRVWISEIMLQQTRVDTVIPYFLKFASLFPTAEALAEADEQSVLKAWEGLGYYSRARNLQAGARQVVSEFGGKVPSDPAAIAKIKGVGPYTAGAILSIAYGKPEPAVDGNVMRVYARIFSAREDIAKPKSRALFEELARETIDASDPSSFNQALMELGALICSPRSPKCGACPVASHCRASRDGIQAELPVKTKAKKPKHLSMAAAILRDPFGNVVIRQRPASGLLADLWEFPNAEASEEGQAEALLAHLESEHGAKVSLSSPSMRLEHVFTHLIWDITVYEGALLEPIAENPRLRLVPADDVKTFPFPVSHQKIYGKLLFSEGGSAPV